MEFIRAARASGLIDAGSAVIVFEGRIELGGKFPMSTAQ